MSVVICQVFANVLVNGENKGGLVYKGHKYYLQYFNLGLQYNKNHSR